jgi:hypothetical protein
VSTGPAVAEPLGEHPALTLGRTIGTPQFGQRRTDRLHVVAGLISLCLRRLERVFGLGEILLGRL